VTSEETIKNQAKDIATLKADIESLKSAIVLGFECMEKVQAIHRADVAVIKASHRAETTRLRYDLSRRGGRISDLKAEMLSAGIRCSLS
jgi:hypothetical protein